MTTKIWRGDAPAVAQVTTVVPATIEAGDVFVLTINGKTVRFAATLLTAAHVCDGLAAAVTDTDIPEFLELNAESADGVLTLTANEPGVPFVVTGSTVNSGASAVTIATTTQGGAATSEVQTFTVPSEATGATWKITFGGQTTTALAIGDSAATVDAALEALSNIGAGDVSVGKVGDVYTVTFGGALANMDVGPLTVQLYYAKPLIKVIQAGAPYGPAQNAIISVEFPDSDVSASTYTLTWNADTTTSAVVDAAQTAEAMQTFLRLNWFLTAPGTVNVTKSGDIFTVEFVGYQGNAAQAITGAATWLAADGRYDLTVTTTTPGSANTNEVQTVTLTPTPTGGTFTLTYSGQTTSAIAYNASAATVDAALEALSNIGAGDVAVTGSAGGPWTVTFGTALANTNVAQMTGNGAALTGASTETLTVTDVTASSGPNHWDTAANWIPSGVPASSDAVRFELGSSDCLYGLLQTGVTLASLHIAMSWTGKLGLSRQNPNGYVEYRTFELTCGITDLIVGTGEGSGSGKVAVNVGSVLCTARVRDSGGSSDSGVPAVTWRGTHASNVITVQGGDFGTCPYSDQTATILTFTQLGGSVFLKHTAITGAKDTTNQSFRAYDCTHGGQALNA